VAFDDGLVFAERLLPAGGHRLGQRLLAERPDVTAVFATSDVLALGLLRACHEAGRRVPEEFAVVGFDDLNSSAFTTPSLATIDQDMRGKGRAAATLVLDQIEGQPARHLVLPVRFVARESAPEVNNEVNTTARKGRPR
jgi:LacI family transcriptional regulator